MNLVASTSLCSSGLRSGDKVFSLCQLGLYRGWQRDYIRRVKMTATPLQNQSAPTVGAESATPDAQAPGIDADQEIISKVLAGHKDAFGVLITRYSTAMLSG
jgi:hypothetical protein